MLDDFFLNLGLYFLGISMIISEVVMERFGLKPMEPSIIPILVMIWLFLVISLIAIGLFNFGNYVEYFLRSKFKFLKKHRN